MKILALVALFTVGIALCLIGGAGTYIGGTILSTLIWVAFMSSANYVQASHQQAIFVNETHYHAHQHLHQTATVNEHYESMTFRDYDLVELKRFGRRIG
jgi:hypothetical protein